MRTAILALLALVLAMPLLGGCVGAPDGAAATGQGADDAFVPFLQQGADAARTGATTDPGPATFDLAFNVTLPGIRWREVVPVVLDGAVYVLMADDPATEADEEPRAVWRIDLATAETELLVPIDERGVQTFSSDGERLFIGHGNHISAYWAANGTPAWDEPYTFPQVLLTPPGHTNCMPGAVAGGILYLGCAQWGETVAAPGAFGVPIETAVLAVTLDAAIGQERWRTALSPQDGSTIAEGHYRPIRLTVRTAVGPGHLYVQGVEQVPVLVEPGDGLFDVLFEPKMRHVIWAFDRDEGDLEWTWRAPPHGGSPYTPPLENTCEWGEDRSRDLEGWINMGMVATPDALYVKADSLHALDPADGGERWELPLPFESDDDCQQANALAFFDDDLYVTQHSRIYQVHSPSQTLGWSARTAPGDHWDDTRDLLVANGAVHGVTDQGRLTVLDIEDGSVLHQRRIGPEQTASNYYVLSAGEGVLVASRDDGTVFVIGRPPAAIKPAASASTTYPDPGASVTLDLSATQPGALSDDLEYQVNWGDGTLTDWQDDPVLTHSYLRAGDNEATARIRNAAGQEATATHTFHVGQTPPVAPGVLQTAFNADNEERSFFVVGLAITAAVGATGYGRHRRRRRRLQDELAAIRAARDMADSPSEVQAALTERRAHVRGLLLDGKLDESQVAVLEGRIDELAREGRLAQLDGRLDYLPHGMVRKLEQALADGTITAWEREDLVRMVEDDGVLTKPQKRDTVALIASWFAEDEGAGQE